MHAIVSWRCYRCSGGGRRWKVATPLFRGGFLRSGSGQGEPEASPAGNGSRRRLGTWRFFALNPYSVVGVEVTSAGAGGNAWKERLKLTTGRVGVRFVAWRPFGGRLGTSALLLSSCELRKCVRAGSSARTFPGRGGRRCYSLNIPIIL
jgi:hypothetical protein